MKPTHGTGLHSISPAHSIEDLKLSYMYDLSRDGIVCSKTGTITEGIFENLKISDPLILEGLK